MFVVGVYYGYLWVVLLHLHSHDSRLVQTHLYQAMSHLCKFHGSSYYTYFAEAVISNLVDTPLLNPIDCIACLWTWWVLFLWWHNG